MVQVKVSFEAQSSDDPYTRSFYASYDEPIQFADRHKLGASYQYFFYVDYRDFADGVHTIYFSCDGEAPYSWLGRIRVNDNVVAEGKIGKDLPPIAAAVTVGSVTTTQTIQASNPATGETVTSTQTVQQPTVSAAPAPPAAPPKKPWYEEYALPIAIVVGLGVIGYFIARRR